MDIPLLYKSSLDNCFTMFRFSVCYNKKQTNTVLIDSSNTQGLISKMDNLWKIHQHIYLILLLEPCILVSLAAGTTD